jgi:hypothetical protein
MSSPYGLQITENCLICKLPEASFLRPPEEYSAGSGKNQVRQRRPAGGCAFRRGTVAARHIHHLLRTR